MKSISQTAATSGPSVTKVYRVVRMTHPVQFSGRKRDVFERSASTVTQVTHLEFNRESGDSEKPEDWGAGEGDQ